MDPVIKKYKKQFDRDLRHIKLILMRARHTLPAKEWLQFVDDTRACILTHAGDFFQRDLPPKEILNAAIETVFEFFLREQRLLAAQHSKGFKLPGSRSQTQRTCKG